MHRGTGLAEGAAVYRSDSWNALTCALYRLSVIVLEPMICLFLSCAAVQLPRHQPPDQRDGRLPAWLSREGSTHSLGRANQLVCPARLLRACQAPACCSMWPVARLTRAARYLVVHPPMPPYCQDLHTIAPHFILGPASDLSVALRCPPHPHTVAAQLAHPYCLSFGPPPSPSLYPSPHPAAPCHGSCTFAPLPLPRAASSFLQVRCNRPACCGKACRTVGH